MPSAKTTRNKHLNTPPTNAQYNAGQIDVTKEEFDRISEAMKKEEFRKLFLDYCEEIQDPENRKRYESEIIQLEAERGVEVKFVNPEPGFVIKTSVNGQTKCFVNVAKSEKVGAPTNKMHLDTNTGERGLNWSLPMAQTAPREDLDAAGKRCTVYDVVFHPDTLRLAENNKAFHKCVVDTALDAVERAFQVNLDRTNLKFPKLDFKGVARPTVIRTLSKHAPAETDEPNPLENIYPAKPTSQESEPKTLPLKMNITKPAEFTTPQYHIKHRRGVDYAECTNELDAKLNVLLPFELVVNIELPLLKSTADCELDVTSHKIYFLSERAGAKYRLNLDLPYEVIDKDGCARFDIETRQLEITLPVKKDIGQQREMINTLLHREDSGVESDIRDEVHNINSARDSPVEADSLIESDDATTTTNVNAESSEIKEFLSDNTPYKFPQKFDCNVLDNMMSLVLHVFNVRQESIKLLQKSQSIHLQFVSMGSGYVATHYAFFLELPQTAGLEIETAQAEAWENNVVLNITLTPSNASAGDHNITCHSYFAGLNSDDLKEYAVQGKFEMPGKPQRKSLRYMDVSVEREEDTVEVAIRPRAHTPPRNYVKNEGKNINKKRKNKKTRSYSESACDDFNKVYNQQQLDNDHDHNDDKDDDNNHELASMQQKIKNLNFAVASDEKEKVGEGEEQIKNNDANERTQARSIPKHNKNNNHKHNNKINGQQQQNRNKQRSYSECRSDSVCSSSNTLPPSFKGILKHRSSYDKRPSISDSCCSSFDDSSYGCSADAGYAGCYSLPKSLTDCIKEEEETTENANMSESCKKTVRFSDNIKQLIFRMDSSILGRRKKNQKCRIRKLRALQRRLSEGDSADYEDNNSVQNNSNNNDNDNKPNNEKYKNKEKSSKKSRSRLESESSSDVENKNSMMFEMDM